MPDEKKPWKKIINDYYSTVTRIPVELNVSHNGDCDTIRHKIIKKYLDDTIECLKSIIDKDIDRIKQIADILIDVHDSRKQVITMGNGGSAAIASHIAADFSKAWLGDRLLRLRTYSLVDNVSQMTAWLNDSGYDTMFIGPLEGILERGDVVIGVSASGNSLNVVKAMKFAKHKGAVTIGFTGFNGGKLKDITDYCFTVPSDSFKRIEDIHSIISHLIKVVLVNEIKTRNLSR